MTDMIRYVLVEEPTAEDPIKLPRAIGNTNDIVAAEFNCFDGEVLVVTTDEITLDNWQNPQFRWFAGIPSDLFHWDDTTNHQRKWIVEYNGGDYQVVCTEPPFISQTYVAARITATLTIS